MRENINLVILYGRLAVDSELRTFDSGTQVVRLQMTVSMEEPKRRVDVVPVTYWVPADEPISPDESLPMKGEDILVIGSVQRRFWDASDGRHSRIEVVAEHIEERNGLGPPDLSLILGGLSEEE